MKICRRDFLRTSSAIGTGLALFSPAVDVFGKATFAPFLDPVGAWKPSTCQGCTTWCPIQCYVQEGRVIKVKGNENSPINSGFVCPRGHFLPKMVYDPDRLKTPLRRTNPVKGKGIDPGFIPISWDEALDRIAEKIIELRTNNETHKYMFLRGRYSGQSDLMYDRLTKIIGSPNNITHSAICAEAEKAGPYFTEGLWNYRDYDLDNTRYVVLWGVDPTRSNRLVPGSIKRFHQLMDNGKVVTIDPQLTTAASKSHVWLPIVPGTDGALASALAHHILVRGLWHKPFVGDFNSGINEFVAGQIVDESHFTEIYSKGLVKWWNIELRDKTPQWAQSITGIPASKIRQVAEEMGAAAPRTIVWLGPGPVMSTRGTYTSMAIHALNGLLGSADNEGGTLRAPSTQTTSAASPNAYMDSIAQAGAARPKIDQRGTLLFPALNAGKSGGGVVTNNVANAMLAQDPYDIKVAICSWGNFAFSTTQPQRWWNALANLPFFAHITTHASEMSMFADIVLPAANSLAEKWSFVVTNGFRHSAVSIQQPLVTPLFEVYAEETEIAFKLAEKLAARGFNEPLDYYMDQFADPDTGANPQTAQEFALFSLKKATRPAYTTIGGWQEFVNRGVVNYGPYPYRGKWGNFGTVSTKFEFYSETLKKGLNEHATKHNTTIDHVLEVCNYEARGELAFVPHYEAPYQWGSEAEYPFTFIDTKSRLNREGRSQNLAWYYNFLKLDPNGLSNEDCVCINPMDAFNLGIADGSMVRIVSVVGSIVSKARLWEGLRPGTIVKSFGQGHWAYGREAAQNFGTATARGSNNNDILPDDYDRLSGSTVRNGGFTRVRIEAV